ncbi:hypothetical protein E2C01_041930 [Portunus trituberculatus]|uniref:Uncharacterized protein n=1 Tax=Portunus trituberculatus TaxID=210409 RepID=A0A5B7FNT8_PORTR|nr:hypothetical protein [Portunus trituberculatus]
MKFLRSRWRAPWPVQMLRTSLELHCRKVEEGEGKDPIVETCGRKAAVNSDSRGLDGGTSGARPALATDVAALAIRSAAKLTLGEVEETEKLLMECGNMTLAIPRLLNTPSTPPAVRQSSSFINMSCWLKGKRCNA